MFVKYAKWSNLKHGPEALEQQAQHCTACMHV